MSSDHHRNATAQSDGSPESHPSPPSKPNPKLLSMFLKAVIMTLVTSLFFLFLGVAAILLLNLCLAGGAVRRRLRRTHRPDPSNGLSREDVKKLSQFRFLESDQEKECVVCLERIGRGQWCRKLAGCGHVFHRRCVDLWLVKVAACPICRSRVGLDSGSVAVGSSAIDDDFMQLWAFDGSSELRVR